MSVPAPEANPLLLGQELAETVFRRALDRGRLPHGWLLRGPFGVGKATLAFRLARLLLGGVQALDPASAVFRMVAAGAHPDLYILRRTVNPRTKKFGKEIGIDAVRTVNERMWETRATAPYRVLVVDVADELSTEAANALLKLLEEPPPATVILLVCERVGHLPRTILSRCAALVLRPLPTIEVETALARFLPHLTETEISALAAQSRGSLGRACDLAATDWLARYAATLEQLAAGAGSEAARLRSALGVSALADDLGIRTAADLLGEVVRRTARHVSGAAGPEIFPGEGRALATIATGRRLDHWVALWDKLASLAARVESLNLDPVQALLRIGYEIGGGEPKSGTARI
ncbi:MAG: AAA family ATPase [Geminicoccaceae bacterium]